MTYQDVLAQIELIEEALQYTARQMDLAMGWMLALDAEWVANPVVDLLNAWHALQTSYEADQAHFNWLLDELESRQAWVIEQSFNAALVA